MAAFVMKDVDAYYDGVEIGCISNQLSVEYKSDLQDATVLCGDTRIRQSGVIDAMARLTGFHPNDINAELFTPVGSDAVRAFSFAPPSQAEGGQAFTFQVKQGGITHRAQHGSLYGFDIELEGNSPLINGKLFARDRKTVTGVSPVIQFVGGVPTNYRVYAALHVYANQGVGGQTFAAILKSSAVVGFTSPSNRITFTTVGTTNGSQLLYAAGPITHEYFRLDWTISGGWFDVYAVVGVTAKK